MPHNYLPPPPRKWTRRLTKKWEELAVNDSVIIDRTGAQSLRAYLQRKGFKCVQKKIEKRTDDKVRVWRVA